MKVKQPRRREPREARLRPRLHHTRLVEGGGYKRTEESEEQEGVRSREEDKTERWWRANPSREERREAEPAEAKMSCAHRKQGGRRFLGVGLTAA